MSGVTPSPLLFKYRACFTARGIPQFSSKLEPSLLEPSLSMSSPSGSTSSGDKVPEGIKEEVKVPETAPSAS
jgi:hypothetical protein